MGWENVLPIGAPTRSSKKIRTRREGSSLPLEGGSAAGLKVFSSERRLVDRRESQRGAKGVVFELGGGAVAEVARGRKQAVRLASGSISPFVL